MNRPQVRNRNRLKAFTMIEILLVVSLASILSVAFYKTLSNALKIWDRAYRLTQEEDLSLFLDRLSFDLRNAQAYSKIPFDADARTVSFASFVHTHADSRKDYPDNAYVDEIGRVEYGYDSFKNEIFRRHANYSQALKGIFLNKRVVARSVRSLVFEYYYLTKGGYVKRNRADHVLPDAVAVHIEYGEKMPKQIVRFIGLP